MPEVLKLHHGTSFDIVGGSVANGKAPLYGKRDLQDRGWSGTLTDDIEYATRIAHRRGADSLVLTYNIPVAFVIDEGLIGMQSRSHGFITTAEVSIDELPPEYLRAVATLNRTNEEMLRFMVERKNISFHQVPIEYFVSCQDV